MNELRDVRSVQQLIELKRRGVVPRYLHFWGHATSRGHAVSKACFSQWYDAPFGVDEIHYPTAEHFMMAEKARAFSDAETRERILSAATPADAKALGRTVKGFDAEVWSRLRFDIVVAGNEAKFSQSPGLRPFLLETGDQVLVEASPVDPVWGIGLAADHDDATEPARWPGLNLLGFALMEVRSRLA